VLAYFIEKQYGQLNAWSLLVGMLVGENESDKMASCKCIQMLTSCSSTKKTKPYWQAILECSGVEALCAILVKYATHTKNKTSTTIAERPTNYIKPSSKQIANAASCDEQQTLALNALSALCNISEQVEVKRRLNAFDGIGETLITLLKNVNNDDIRSRACILLADLACVDENRKPTLANQGALDILMSLLDSDMEHLLVNAVNSIEIMCTNCVKNQNYCCEHDILLDFISLLELNSGKDI
jgi:hypothetical protein